VCVTSPIGSCDKGYDDSVDVGSDFCGSTLSARILLASACKTETKCADCRLKHDLLRRHLSSLGSVNVCMYFSPEYLYLSNYQHRNNNFMCLTPSCFVCVCLLVFIIHQEFLGETPPWCFQELVKYIIYSPTQLYHIKYLITRTQQV